MTQELQPQVPRAPTRVVLLVALLVVGLVLTGGVALITGPVPRPPTPTGPTPAPTIEIGPEGFPTEVLGMPVVSVLGANRLIASGTLDGREAAVGGWWQLQLAMSCPMPTGYVPALIGFCEYQTMASAPYATWQCDPTGSRCGTVDPPSGAGQIVVRSMPESVGVDLAESAASSSQGRVGAPVVVLGHSGDPRFLQCGEGDQAEQCRHVFVIDRVVWLNGATLDQISATATVTTGLAPDEAVVLAHKDGAPVVAVSIRAGDAMTIDPRFHGVGNAPVWIVKTLRAGEITSDSDPTRAVDVTLLDEAAGAVVSSVGLELPTDPELGTVLIQATQKVGTGDFQVYPYYRIETQAGVGLQEMRIGQNSLEGQNGIQRYTAGLPVVLEPGDYVVRAWQAVTGDDANVGAGLEQCLTPVHVDAGETIRLQADFPGAGRCSFDSPTFE